MAKTKLILGECIFLFMLVAGLMPVAAQGTSSPLVFVMNGDLWKWSPGQGQPTQMTFHGYNFRPMISPDGTRVAYKSWADMSVEFLNAGGGWAGDLPANIWVMNVNTLDAVRVAEQPVNASIDNVNGAVNTMMRSDPAWSPDGNSLAWVEYNGAALQLVVYDFATDSSRLIVPELPFPFMDGGVYVPPVKWGHGGISYTYFGILEGTQDFGQVLYIYRPDGTLVSAIEISGSTEDYVIEEFWFGNNIGMVTTGGNVLTLNLDSGIVEPAHGTPSLQAGGGATATALQMIPGPTDGTYNISWYVIDNTLNVLGQLPYFGTENMGGIAPGPDGMSYAFITDALYVWSDGNVTQVPGTQGIAESNFGYGAGVAWAYKEWGIQSGGAESQPGQELGFCEGNVPPRLVMGQRGRVIPGLGANVIRSQPNKSSSSVVTGSIPEGGEFTVLKGPVCGDNINWWMVDYNGIIGWTGESEGQTYWVEPR